jgi:hypothetical protein
VAGALLPLARARGVAQAGRFHVGQALADGLQLGAALQGTRFLACRERRRRRCPGRRFFFLLDRLGDALALAFGRGAMVLVELGVPSLPVEHEGALVLEQRLQLDGPGFVRPRGVLQLLAQRLFPRTGGGELARELLLLLLERGHALCRPLRGFLGVVQLRLELRRLPAAGVLALALALLDLHHALLGLLEGRLQLAAQRLFARARRGQVARERLPLVGRCLGALARYQRRVQLRDLGLRRLRSVSRCSAGSGGPRTPPSPARA